DGQGAGHLYQFVIDLRKEAIRDVLCTLLRLPLCFVGHFAHAETLCLLKLQLPEPAILWDTWVHEKAQYLGRHHKNYKLKPGADEGKQARAHEEAREEEEFSSSLVATCQRYGISYPFATDKERLRHSFLLHPDDAPFTDEQIRYAAADAEAAARLYPLQ